MLSNDDVWDCYQRWLAGKQRSPVTVAHYRFTLRDFWSTPKRQGRTWADVGPDDLERFLERICHRHRRHDGRALARNSRAAYSRRVLHFYRWATDHGLLARNPFVDVEPVARARPQASRRTLALDKVAKLLRATATDRRLWIMVALGYYQLLRVGEIVRLSVDDIDLEAPDALLRVQGKGGQETWMALNPTLLPHLRGYLDWLADAYGVAGWQELPAGTALVSSRTQPGRHLSPSYGSQLLAEVMLPVVGQTAHALRHTGASALRTATGSNLLAIQQAGRWRSAESVRVYLDDQPHLVAGFLAQLPDPLSGQADLDGDRGG